MRTFCPVMKPARVLHRQAHRSPATERGAPSGLDRNVVVPVASSAVASDSPAYARTGRPSTMIRASAPRRTPCPNRRTKGGSLSSHAMVPDHIDGPPSDHHDRGSGISRSDPQHDRGGHDLHTVLSPRSRSAPRESGPAGDPGFSPCPRRPAPGAASGSSSLCTASPGEGPWSRCCRTARSAPRLPRPCSVRRFCGWRR